MCNKPAMDANKKERYIRWQDYRITQLSFSINLFIGFAIASLAFVISIKLEGKPHGTIPLETVMVWWTASAVFGCIATLSKLFDYRYTAWKIRDGGSFNTCMAKCCGHITWVCFGVQVVSYTIGAYKFVTGVV